MLVVSADRELRHTICTTLATTGLTFEQAANGVEAARRIIRQRYNLVLIGFGEQSSGELELCRHLRAVSPDLGIVLIRSGGTEADEIRGLEAGADDCVAIPLRFREVVGRLRAVLRRPLPGVVGGTVLRVGDVKIDITRRLCWRAHRQIHLSPREFDLLAILMKHKERALTHVKLRIAVWGPEVKFDVDHLRSYVKALRKKIEPDPGRPKYIRTVPWVGYMFCDPRQPAVEDAIE